MTIRVLLADDHEDVRLGFRLTIDAQPDMAVVAEAADGREALAQVAEHRPDVVLTDIRMPGIDGLELTRRLAGPGVVDPVRVVVVTTFGLDEYAYTALQNGACGFLLKRSDPGLLAESVRVAVAGDTLVSPSLTLRLLEHVRGRVGQRPPDPVEALTARETEVARLVAEGLTNAEIGARLFISPGTARTHVAHVHRKLGSRNRVEIAAWAWGSGLMD